MPEGVVEPEISILAALTAAGKVFSANRRSRSWVNFES